MAVPVSTSVGVVGNVGAETFGGGIGIVGMEPQRAWTPVPTQAQSFMVIGPPTQMPMSMPGLSTGSIQNVGTMLEPQGMMSYGGWTTGVSSLVTPITIFWYVPAPTFNSRPVQVHDGTNMGSWTGAPSMGHGFNGGQRWLDIGAADEMPPPLPVLSVSVDGMRFPFRLLQDDIFRVFSRYGIVRSVHVKPEGNAAEVTFQDFASAWAAAVDLDRKSLPELEATLCVQMADNCLPTAEDLLRCLAAVEENVLPPPGEGESVPAARREEKSCTSKTSASSPGISCCVVCQDAPRCIVFEPCKHLVCCSTCGGRASQSVPRLHRCPVCRAEILRRLEVFVS